MSVITTKQFKHMKKILLLLIVLFVSTYSFSHTTEEEYSYVTKGLKIQIDGGLDMKKGYELKTVKVLNSNLKRAELGQLIRTSDKSIACYWLKFTNFKTYYFCLPNPDSTTDLINKCNSDLIKGMNAHSMSMVVITMLNGLQWQVKQ